MAEATPNTDIPVLTDAVEDDEAGNFPSHSDTLIAELQTNLAASAFALTERLLHQALAEMEAAVSVLRRHLGTEDERE
jgi:hypothetical protein